MTQTAFIVGFLFGACAVGLALFALDSFTEYMLGKDEEVNSD